MKRRGPFHEAEVNPRLYIIKRIAVDENGCWVWLMATSNGYGVAIVRRRNISAHRLAYETFVGPAPEGMDLDHLCRNRACCNPEHLEPVTRVVNLRRGVAARVGVDITDKCRNGHPRTPENGYKQAGRSTLQCLECQREASRRSYERRLARLSGSGRAS